MSIVLLHFVIFAWQEKFQPNGLPVLEDNKKRIRVQRETQVKRLALGLTTS